MGIRYYAKYGGRYIKERDMDPTMHKNDRGASMQRKRSWLDDSAGLSGKSLGSERSVSRSRDPSQHSRGESSVRADSSVYIPAHQRDRRIGESNSDFRRKKFYDQRREAGSSRDHGHGSTRDRERSKDYGKDSERDQHKGTARDLRGSGRDPTPDRRSHSREVVDDHRKRVGDARDKKDGQDTRDGRRDSSPHPARDRSRNCECTQVDDDYTNVCAFLDAAPVAKEADRADDRLLSASIPHLSGTTVEETTSNLTINHPNIIIGNKVKVNSIDPILTIDHLQINHAYVRIANSLHIDRLLPFALSQPNTRTKIELAHDDVVINNNLDVNFITAQDMDLDINAVGFAINLGNRTNEINIGNKANPNGCDIYFYGRVHHIVNASDNGFFEEVNGFLNQSGI